MAGPPNEDLLLRENLEAVRARVAAAARGRDVTLLAVTKSVEPEVARGLVRAGQRELAENRAAGLREKVTALADLDVRWHFVGHIQRNKARRIVELADVVHSVDSVRLAETLERVAADLGRTVEVYAQVNVTGEEQKQGVRPEEVPEVFEVLRKATALRPLGLMAMGPTGGDEETTRAAFARAAGLARELEADDRTRACLVGGRCRLSMGMSGDLELAIEAGADVVRVGRALFRSPEANGGPSGAEGR